MTTHTAVGARGQVVPLTRFYERMATIRAVEEALLSLFSQGRLNGTVHTCIGQEACAVGVVAALDPDRDVLFSNHRGHGHFIAYCDDVDGLVAEVMGRESGVCRGIGGSQHLHSRNFYSNGIQGGIVPVATGMAMAEKHLRTGAIAAVFLGDGTFGEGVVYESLNIASLWSLPVLFVVEHNGYAQSTPTSLEHAGDISTRAVSFGIPVTLADGNDVVEVHAAANRVVDEIRETSTPRVLFLRTYRLGPHSKGDDTRDPTELARHNRSEPLVRARRSLDSSWCDAVDLAARDRVSRAIELAEASNVADFAELEARWRR